MQYDSFVNKLQNAPSKQKEDIIGLSAVCRAFSAELRKKFNKSNDWGGKGGITGQIWDRGQDVNKK